jgi:hypothetical protein
MLGKLYDCLGSRALKPLMFIATVILMMLAIPSSASAYLSVASDTWSDQEPAANGDFRVYGRGTADTDTGWCYADAWLRNPSGGGLDASSGSGNSSAQADVSYLLNAFNMQSGDYSTLATGRDVEQSSACETSLFGITPFTDWAERTAETCSGGAFFVYHSQCNHACAVAQDYCAVFGFTSQQVSRVGLRFRTFGYSWCGGGVWYEGSGFCLAPAF